MPAPSMSLLLAVATCSFLAQETVGAIPLTHFLQEKLNNLRHDIPYAKQVVTQGHLSRPLLDLEQVCCA